MWNERVTIYEDKEIKVEVLKVFHDFFDSLKVKEIKLTKLQHQLLLKAAIQDILKKGINTKDCKLLCSSSVPIIEYWKPLTLVEDFTILEFAINLLCMTMGNEDIEREDLVKAMEEHYKAEEIPFLINFYFEPAYQVDGYIAAKNEDKILIVFFKLDENSIEGDNEIYL